MPRHWRKGHIASRRMFRFTRHFDAGKILSGADHQIGKRFVILQFAVVFGLYIFYQPRFHQEGVHFTFAFDIVRIGNFVDPIARPEFLRRPLEKVTAGAGLQVLGLADIDHATCRVLQQVDTWRLGKPPDLVRSPLKGQPRVEVLGAVVGARCGIDWGFAHHAVHGEAGIRGAARSRLGRRPHDDAWGAPADDAWLRSILGGSPRESRWQKQTTRQIVVRSRSRRPLNPSPGRPVAEA